MAKQQHVVPHGNEWAVLGAGNQKYTALYTIQKDAISRGREIAKNQKTELVIHGRNGRIRDKDSYGDDNCPPRDTVF